MKLPIRYILLGAFLLAGLLPTILIATLAYQEARSALISEITNDLQTRAAATADEIDRMMFERLQNVASWSKLELMQDVRIGDVDKRLSKFLDEVKDSYQDVYTELYVLDRHGLVVASSDPARLAMKPAPLGSWLHTQLADTRLDIAPLQQEQLSISTAIPDATEPGQLGTLVAVFNWRQIASVLDNTISGRSAAALLDARQQLIASTASWQQTQGLKNIYAEASTKGYQSFQGLSWRIRVAKHRSEAFTPIHHMTSIFTSLLLATIVLATLIAIPVARSITRPLALLTGFASNFMRNATPTLPPQGGPAEIDAMAHAFAKMIADLERSKENLTRAAKLAVVGEMAAAMSHEVRTPLGILRSSAQVLLREPTLTAEGKEVCGFIISETERLNKLVSTLIDSARPRAPEFVVSNLADLAQQAVSMLRMQAQKKNISLRCETEPAFAPCDHEQITQVLLNLLLNAIQVLEQGGHIQVSVIPQDGQILIAVADDGPGIPQAQRQQIFDPFFTQRAGGIGLGLAVVRQIVLAHHGDISVHPSSLGGAEFRVRLPVHADAALASTPKNKPRKGRRTP